MGTNVPAPSPNTHRRHLSRAPTFHRVITVRLLVLTGTTVARITRRLIPLLAGSAVRLHAPLPPTNARAPSFPARALRPSSPPKITAAVRLSSSRRRRVPPAKRVTPYLDRQPSPRTSPGPETVGLTPVKGPRPRLRPSSSLRAALDIVPTLALRGEAPPIPPDPTPKARRRPSGRIVARPGVQGETDAPTRPITRITVGPSSQSRAGPTPRAPPRPHRPVSKPIKRPVRERG